MEVAKALRLLAVASVYVEYRGRQPLPVSGSSSRKSHETPQPALDFSPITDGDPCDVSPAWATASAPGLIVRAADNAVALDLHGDGRESTGWLLLYYHPAASGVTG